MKETVFIPGRYYPTRSGHRVLIEREENGVLYGSAFAGAVKFEWWPDGAKRPRGGLDPFDLVEK